MTPPTGPLTADQFAAIAAAPHAGAAIALRRYDPMWGRAEGEAIRWDVRLRRELLQHAVVRVEAVSEGEARRLAEQLYERDDGCILWDNDDDVLTGSIGEVSPSRWQRPPDPEPRLPL